MRKLTIAAMCLVYTALILTGRPASAEEPNNDFKLTGGENSVFVYGSFINSSGLAPNQFDYMMFYQINPDMPTQEVMADTDSIKLYWIAKDVMPGGTFKLVDFNEKSGNTYYYSFPGMQGKSITDFTTPVEPGIYFAGACEITKDGAQLNKTPEAELKILKSISLFKMDKTWAQLIKARIQELEDAK